LARHGVSYLLSQLLRLKQEDCKFKASLGNIARPCVKITKQSENSFLPQRPLYEDIKVGLGKTCRQK
jgi:hypothetical protein